MRPDKASKSAVQVAQMLIFVGCDPRRSQVPPSGSVELTRQLLSAQRLWRPLYERLSRSRWYQRLIDLVVEPLGPGHLTYLALRKRFLNQETREAIQKGALQLLIVGGGFDTLALRIAREHSQVAVFEIDHPASQRVKVDAVKALGGAPENLDFLAVDLAVTPLSDVMRDCGWDYQKPSVVVVEGVLMYLEKAAVESLLEAVCKLTPSGSMLLFSWFEVGPDGRINLGRFPRLMKLSFSLAGEPLRWTTTEADLIARLAHHDLRFDADPARYDLRRRFLEPEGLGNLEVGKLERVGVAERIAR